MFSALICCDPTTKVSETPMFTAIMLLAMGAPPPEVRLSPSDRTAPAIAPPLSYSAVVRSAPRVAPPIIETPPEGTSGEMHSGFPATSPPVALQPAAIAIPGYRPVRFDSVVGWIYEREVSQTAIPFTRITPVQSADCPNGRCPVR